MIFISYSWHDHFSVKRVENILTDIGIEYWIDRANLDLNGCIKSQIKLALQRSDYVLHVASEASRLSPWVQYEKRIALLLGKTILELDLDQNYLKHRINSLSSDNFITAFPTPIFYRIFSETAK